jgi:hypothetical protein
MKKKLIGIGVFITIVFYIAASIGSQTFNIFLWSETATVIAPPCWLICMIGISIAFLQIEDKKP